MTTTIRPVLRPRTVRRPLVPVFAGLAFLACAVGSAAPPAPATVLVSVKSTGAGGANESSGITGLSADGHVVAFASLASDLVADDGNGTTDVFVRDTRKAKTTLVSVNAAGTGSGNGASSGGIVSADGRFVVFSSTANDLVANDGNGSQDIFLRDLRNGTTALVSANAAGTASGDGTSSFPFTMSPDGRFVAFSSASSDLVAGDMNGAQDIFVRDTRNGTTAAASVNVAGTGTAAGSSSNPVGLSANGRFVVFDSLAPDLVTNDGNGTLDVFVRDLRKGTTTLVSVNSAGLASGNGSSRFPAMTPDGRRVAFVSTATDLVEGLPPLVTHLFVRDLKGRSTVVVSVDAGGTNFTTPRMSANGRFVAFLTTANTVFRTDTKKGTTTIVTVTRVGVAASSTTTPEMSADGRFVGFTSANGDLVAGDTNQKTDAFVRDAAKGTTVLLSVLPAGTGGGNANTNGPVLFSANGRIAAFSSAAEDLVANDGNLKIDGFLRAIR